MKGGDRPGWAQNRETYDSWWFSGLFVIEFPLQALRSNSIDIWVIPTVYWIRCLTWVAVSGGMRDL